MLTECWGDNLSPTDALDDWIWHGFLRLGQITLVTGLPKTGKTTLLSHILAHRQTGTPLLDRPMRPGVTVVLSEEGRLLWHPRCQKLDFGRDVCFFFRPFSLRPTQDEFTALIGQLLDLKARRGVDLVVFDTLSRFLPLRELDRVHAASASAAHQAGRGGSGHAPQSPPEQGPCGPRSALGDPV